ncbi:SGNH/GDSL hydrolase family protein [Metabacillus sp. 113a]|uniref:SGNH/GDSL hydrolase family protein n=1 Tax=Metabacillus sp. 113a TaxID=3404706 RepID=UPI003CFBA971
MKKTAVVLTALVSISGITAGKLYWNEKIESQTSAVSGKALAETAPAADQPAANAMGEAEGLTKNLPPAAAKAIVQAEKTGKPAKLVLFGSDTAYGEKDSWANQFTEQIKAEYPSGLLEIETIFIKDKTSKEVIGEKLYSKAAEAKPDLLLFEPFILEDNGEVGIRNTFDNLSVMIEGIRSQSKDAVIMLQPSYPLQNAIYYPKEVEQLQEFADKAGYAFLNHWENWPAGDSEEMAAYLQEDGNGPSSKGHSAWAEYLAKVFISKK